MTDDDKKKLTTVCDVVRRMCAVLDEHMPEILADEIQTFRALGLSEGEVARNTLIAESYALQSVMPRVFELVRQVLEREGGKMVPVEDIMAALDNANTKH